MTEVLSLLQIDNLFSCGVYVYLIMLLNLFGVLCDVIAALFKSMKMADEYERIGMVKQDVFIYQIPPRASNRAARCVQITRRRMPVYIMYWCQRMVCFSYI